MSYYSYLDILSDLFGKENIIVKRFDRTFFKNGSLIDDFMNIFGIEVDDTFPKESSKSEQNHGITENACAIKRVINTIDGIPDAALVSMKNLLSKRKRLWSTTKRTIRRL